MAYTIADLIRQEAEKKAAQTSAALTPKPSANPQAEALLTSKTAAQKQAELQQLATATGNQSYTQPSTNTFGQNKYSAENPFVADTSYLQPARTQTIQNTAPTPANPIKPVSAEGNKPVVNIYSGSMPKTTSQFATPENVEANYTDMSNYNPYSKLEQMGQMYQPAYDEVRGRADAARTAREEALKKLEEDRLKKEAEQTKRIEDQYAISRQALERQGSNAIEEAQQNLAFSGFGRSTKAADVVSNIGMGTQAQLAQLEYQKGNDIATAKAELAKMVDEQLKPFDEELKALQTEEGNIRSEELKAKGELMKEILKNDPNDPMNQIDLAMKMADLKIKNLTVSKDLKEASKAEMDNIINNAVKYGYMPESMTDEQKANLAYNLGIPVSKIPDVIGKAIKQAQNEAKKGNIQYQTDNDGNVTAIMFNPLTGEFDTQNIGKYGKGTETRYQAVTNPITGQVQIFDPLTGSFVQGSGQGAPKGYNLPTTPGQPGKVVITANNDNTPANLKNNCVFFARSIVKDFPKVGVSEKSHQENAQGKRNAINSKMPAAGAVAIMPEVGFYGHVGVVESVNADGTITMVEANNPAGTIRRRTGTPQQMKIEGFYISGNGAKVQPSTSIQMYGNERANSNNQFQETDFQYSWERNLSKGIQMSEQDKKMAMAEYFQDNPNTSLAEFNNRWFSAQLQGETMTKPADQTEIRQVRQEYNKIAQTSQDALKYNNSLQTTWNAYKSGTIDKGTADNAIIMLFSKMLDPGSVVREGEFDRVINGQSLLTYAENLVNSKASGGYALDDNQRASLVALANEFAKKQKEFAYKQQQFYQQEAEYMNVPSERITGAYDFSPEQYKRLEAELQPGEVLVINKNGEIGAIPANEYSPLVYTIL